MRYRLLSSFSLSSFFAFSSLVSRQFLMLLALEVENKTISFLYFVFHFSFLFCLLLFKVNFALLFGATFHCEQAPIILTLLHSPSSLFRFLSFLSRSLLMFVHVI